MQRSYVFFHLLNDRSGSPTVLRSSIEALANNSERVIYVGEQGRGALEDLGVMLRRYWYRRSERRLVTLFTYLFSQFVLYRSLRLAKDIPPHAILYVNTLLPFAAMIWGKMSGRKVLVHVHEASISPAPLRWFLCRIAGFCATQLIYVSQDHLLRLPISGPPARVIPNPVSSEIEERAASHIPQRSPLFRVLMLASPRPYKGVAEFMRLADTLRNHQNIAFELVLNAEKSECVNFSRSYPFAENVSIHPRTDQPAEFYSRADLVLNLTRVDQVIETFGLTLVEAMTFGIPVICPPMGGPAEIVRHGEEGYCIDSRDINALKNAVIKLASEPLLVQKMAGACRRRAGDFTYSAYAKRINSVMRKLNAQ